MPSKYTISNESKHDYNTSFVNHINFIGALHKPKDMTNHSYKRCFFMKTIFQVSSSLTRTWWYIDLRCSLVKYLACYNWCNKSSILGRGCWFFSVILFRSMYLIHIHQVPSFFCTIMIGDHKVKWLVELFPTLTIVSTVSSLCLLLE